MSPDQGRRFWLTRALAAVGAAAVAGCDQIAHSPKALAVIGAAEQLNRRVQRLVTPREALAPEFSEAEIAPVFRPNGETEPSNPDYIALLANNFADWRLQVGGLVERPLSLSLTELRSAPGRTQITRHDCVEGWSCIGKWSGARLGPLLQRAGLKPQARYIVFHCADEWFGPPGRGVPYYESIDLIDAFHPQTILAYDLNGQPLPMANGAPLRLRVERQLGYKMAKFVMRIEAVESLAGIGRGKGGFWPDQGYEWYAGI
ncbi:MAG: molybdopterin-binding protein [Caulobacter vibrioides]|uniref:Molybdopterin-binding protein n=1 Tax=Caulobacter vibrioides TaxID=155892 RepID=A0A258D9V8_CAUVI|nr:MAG: molybdopterin-binding protein [Caulobacter vibrioides]